MAEIYSTGKQSVDAIGGGLRFEQDNNRIIGRAEDNKPNLIISSVPGESPLIEVALDGYDVLSATDDQKVMSSRFNMYKIIASGDLSVAPRNANITLTGNNIGYLFHNVVENVVPAANHLQGNLLVSVTGMPTNYIYVNMDIRGSGNFYDDGTNKAIYDYCYRIYESDLHIEFKVRLTAGSLTFNPNNMFNGNMHWDICNHTYNPLTGGGVVLPGDGKYYYYDYVIYNPDGTIKTALASSLQEFKGGESKHFPKPNAGIIGYYRW